LYNYIIFGAKFFFMDKLIRFTTAHLSKITSHRSGEVKYGEKMVVIPKDQEVIDFLQNCEQQFVLFGIPEDIGVRANYGRPGAATAWESAIKSIANIQHNRFCKASQIVILGHLDFSEEMKLVQDLDFNKTDDRKKMHLLVELIDKEVAHLVSLIVKAGKIPIIIGGGHNNAYGNIKGTALGNGKPINAINFDAHSDFRIIEGRHSGNGFKYAYEEGFLKNYFIFGLHESYTSKSVLKELVGLEERIQFNTYDEVNIRREKNFENELQVALNFIKNDCYGVEIDLDAIPNIASSAMTLSGFSVEELRRFIYFFAKHKNASYLHIAEGAPSLDNDKNNHLTGKLIGYLITDFIKGKTENLP
jgi:formiminoglutamase